MTDEPSPEDELTQFVAGVVSAVRWGDASDYTVRDLLITIGAAWISRRHLAGAPDTDPDIIEGLDQALELLTAEIDARGVLAANPLPDVFDPDDPGTS